MSAAPETTTIGTGELEVEVSHGFSEGARRHPHPLRRAAARASRSCSCTASRSSGSCGATSSPTSAATTPSTRPTCAATTSPTSPPDVDAYRMRHLLGDVTRAGRRARTSRRFTLVGHDWGGIVCWAFALKHPELLERFVIIDSPPPFTWNRDLRESPKQREAVNYMLELSTPSPGPEEMVAADDFAMLDSMLERIGGSRRAAERRRARRLPRGLGPAGRDRRAGSTTTAPPAWASRSRPAASARNTRPRSGRCASRSRPW